MCCSLVHPDDQLERRAMPPADHHVCLISIARCCSKAHPKHQPTSASVDDRSSGFIDPAAAEHGALGSDGEEARRIDGQQIVIPDDQVCELTGLEGTLDALLE